MAAMLFKVEAVVRMHARTSSTDQLAACVEQHLQERGK